MFARRLYLEHPIDPWPVRSHSPEGQPPSGQGENQPALQREDAAVPRRVLQTVLGPGGIKLARNEQLNWTSKMTDWEFATLTNILGWLSRRAPCCEGDPKQQR